MLKTPENILSKLALVGYGISKSKSPLLYRHLLGPEVKYDLIDCHDLTCSHVHELLKKYDGINITAPFKKSAALCVERFTGISQELMLVNCLTKYNDIVIGTNSDWEAASSLFIRISKRHNIDHVVLLGDGAMATLFKLLFKKLEIEFVQYSRKQDRDFFTKDYSLEHRKILIVNTCLRSYLFKNSIGSSTIFWDLNYSNPQQQQAIEQQNAIYYDGLSFLIRQGKAAINFWSDPVGYSLVD